MARTDGRIEPGEPLAKAISARAWNRAQDAADLVLGDALSVSPPAGQGASASAFNRVMAKNTSGSTIPWMGGCQITGITPSAGASANGGANAQFFRSPTVTVAIPSSASTTAAVAVALQPIKPGQCGWVAVAGIIQCVASITDSAHTRLSLGGATTQLASGSSGQLELLWKEGVGSGKLALARFSASAAGSSIKVTTTTADWAKGSTASFTFSGETITVYNNRSKVLAGKWVAFGKADDGLYYLIDCEMDQVTVVWNAEITSTTSGGVTTSNLTFRRKKVWVVSSEADTDVNIALAECVPTYGG